MGNRSLSCLGFTGTVNFPYTFSQVTAGLSLSLPPGSYTFTFVGFSGSGVASPASVAQLFSGSSELKAFVLAEANGTVAAGGQFAITSTYNEGTATDRIAGCPPLTQRLHAAVIDNSAIYYHQRVNGSWQMQNINTGVLIDEAHLFVEDGGAAHLSFYNNTASYGIQYGNNRTGSFSFSAVVDSSTTNGRDFSDLAVSPSGEVSLLLNRSNLGAMNPEILSDNNGAGWGYKGPGYTSSNAYYSDMRLAISPTGKLFAAGVDTGGASTLRAAVRSEAQVWGGPAAITQAGANSCSDIRSPAISFDPNEQPHMVYVCAAIGNYHIGYANQILGPWINSAPYGSSVLPSYPAMDIDAQGRMHLAYALGTNLYYQYGNSATGSWSDGGSIGNAGYQFQSVQILASSSSDISILTLERVLSQSLLYFYHFDGANWSKDLIAGYSLQAKMAEGFFLK